MDTPEARASLLLYLMDDLGDFVGSPTVPNQMPGYSEVSVHFDSFYAYDDNLEKIVEEAYSPPENLEATTVHDNSRTGFQNRTGLMPGSTDREPIRDLCRHQTRLPRHTYAR